MDRFDRSGAEAIDINAQSFRMRPRYIKGLDATVLAETVFRDLRIERIGRQIVLAPQQTKIVARNEEMQVTAHVTNAAITSCSFDSCRRVDLKLHFAAVAPASMRGHASSTECKSFSCRL